MAEPTNVIPIKSKEPPGPPEVRHPLEPLRGIFDRLYQILAEIDCASSILNNAEQPTDLECRAANLLHFSVKRLEKLHNDLDQAIIDLKPEVGNG